MKYLAATVAILLLPIVIACIYFSTPTVYAESADGRAIIHCEVLGEYPSDVSRIEIIEVRTGRVIWKVNANGGHFQIHKFELVLGSNVSTLQPNFGNFQNEIPQQGPFYLGPKTPYRASVCSSGRFSICRMASFTL